MRGNPINAGLRFGVLQLTNDALWSDDGRTHLLHLRPCATEYSFFYNITQARRQIAETREKRSDATFSNKRGDQSEDQDRDRKRRLEERLELLVTPLRGVV